MSEVLRPAGRYESVVIHQGIAYVSGQLPRQGNQMQFVGRIGRELTLEEGCEAARLCAARALTVLEQALGGRMRIIRLLRVTGHVSSLEDFTHQSQVLDAASSYFEQELGPQGAHARTACGVYNLPQGAPVCIEVQAAVRD